MMAVVTVLYVGVWMFTFFPSWFTNGEGDLLGAVFALFFFSFLIYLLVLFIGVVNVVVRWWEKCSGG